MLLPSDPSCVLVQMSARTLRDAPAYRRMSRNPLGGLPMSRIASVPQVVTAQLDEVRPAAMESTQLQLVRSGSLILQQGGRQTRFQPGDVAVYDVSQPFEFIYPDEFATVIVQVPTTELGRIDPRLRDDSMPRQGASVLAALLRATDEHYENLTSNSRKALSRAVIEAARSYAGDDDRDERRSRSAAVVADRARSYAARHASDVTLSSSHIAARLHISRRTLHSAFADERETLGQFIRSVRIARARELLLTTAYPVGAVAQQVGYLDATSFIRAFKSSEGATPLVWRRRHLDRSFPDHAS